MATVANSLVMTLATGWKQEQTNEAGAFGKTSQGPDSLAARFTPSASTFTEVLLDTFTLAAAASSTINFNSFTTLLNTTATITKLKGVLVKATATVTGGQLRIAPGSSNALTWPLAGTSPTITLDVGTDGCAIALYNGTTVTVSGAIKNWDFSNPGSQTITVSISAFVGA